MTLRLKPNASDFSFSTGQKGELLAAEYLVDLGYEILERNVQCGFGEIDIVARYKGILIFVEVKTRSSEDYGRPEEAVDEKKQTRLLKLAEYYLKIRSKLSYEKVRLDIISVLMECDKEPEIKHFENAFEKKDEI